MFIPFRRKANNLHTAIAAVTYGVLLAGASSHAAAQQNTPELQEIQEVVVTGSRIRRSTTIENIVVTDISAAQMDTRGYVNAIESLEQLPFVTVGVNNQGNKSPTAHREAETAKAHRG